MKKLIALSCVLSLALVGVAQGAQSRASKTKEVERLCVWVEKTGTPDTRFDLKSVKAYTAVQKICIVGKKGKPGKNGKNGKNGKAGAKGATGAQGLAGLAGAKGEVGAKGETGAKGNPGADGRDGENGQNGTNGQNGVSVTSAVEPAGENCPAGGSVFTAANGVTYACNGAKGDKGDPGRNGLDGKDGSITGIITVEGSFKPGEKTIIVNCDPGFKAVSGGYNIQGSVTASYRSDSAGDDSGDTSWTVTQTSGNTGSGKAYVYCAAVS
jgi:Collagen triple helix repeat (20 copies)